MIGTGNVKPYKTDLIMFQKGKNVLVFRNDVKIIGGKFVFPKDALVYDIN